MKFGRPEVGEIARCLMDKKNKISVRAPAAASVRIAPKISQGQLQTIYSEFPKFHPNPFTSGGVIVERVNIVLTRHKVFAILGEASASSPSKNGQRQSCSAINCLSSCINILAGGSSVPLIYECKVTDPHWKHLRCTHFAPYSAAAVTSLRH